MGLKDLFKGGGGMQDPVRGTAQVVSASMNRGRGVYQSCTMQLVVQAEGVPATAVSFSGLVHHSRWPTPRGAPRHRRPREPQNVNIEWDEVPSSRDRSRQSAESHAATMRGEGATAGGGATGTPTIVNLSGRDLSKLTEEQRTKLRMLGVDPDALAAQRAAAEGAPAPPPPKDGGEGEQVDERLERLERLTKLKEPGSAHRRGVPGAEAPDPRGVAVPVGPPAVSSRTSAGSSVDRAAAF